MFLFTSDIRIALSILSLGIFTVLAACIADLNLGFVSGSFDPNLAATVISFESLEKIFERCLSARPFLCLMPAQCEWPAINYISLSKAPPTIIGSTFLAKPVSSSAFTIKPEIVASPSAG